MTPPGDGQGRCFRYQDIGHLVLGTFTSPLTDAAFEAFLGDLDVIYQRRKRFVFVLDASRMPDVSVPQRRRQAQWMKENEALFRRYLIGVAFVFSSPALRFVLSSIFLMRPLPVPYTVCSTQEEALAWAGQALRKAGIEPAPMLVQARARPAARDVRPGTQAL